MGFGLRLLRRNGLPEAVLVTLQAELHLLLICFSLAIPYKINKRTLVKNFPINLSSLDIV